ncbi:MAG: alpha-ketoglutarate-dependent dioxygenase AlkB [Actinomycetota bacterium]
MVDAPLPLSLFGAGPTEVTVAPRFRRTELDPCCWVDYVDGFIQGADALFARVEAGLDWFHGERLMYGNWLEEPRLTARMELSDPEVPWVVRTAVRALSAHYRRTFDGLFCNFYRSGQDSVAWHADRIGRTTVDPLVAIISLGGPRTFAIRDQSRASEPHRFLMHSGDLLVMGGATQHHWEHSVPKTAAGPPRISLTTRAGWARGDPGPSGSVRSAGDP